jgi:hypothetical protein
MKDQSFEEIAAEYEKARQRQPTFDKEIASHGAKLLNHGVPARQVLDTCLKIDAKRKSPAGRASVEFTLKWLLEKKLAERNGGNGNERP